MRLLFVVGAGASNDCWPGETLNNSYPERLPLANSLFATLPTQDRLLNLYQLMGLASQIRGKSKFLGDQFDIETVLADINETANTRDDLDTKQNLFKTRFYLHRLINELNNYTLEKTSSHTIYVDFINKIKGWIDESPKSRFVDVVSFNYDTLIESAMATVYPYNWHNENIGSRLDVYYRINNLHIYKPHGSINWGREILNNNSQFFYNSPDNVFSQFQNLDLTHSYKIIDPNIMSDSNSSKNFVPAIAVPFKGKTHFDECPEEMRVHMLDSVLDADKVITIGWKGADEHFTKLFKENKKINEVSVISPAANTNLGNVFEKVKIRSYKSTFRNFVNETDGFDLLLNKFNAKK